MRERRWSTIVTLVLACVVASASCGSKGATMQPRSSSDQVQAGTGANASLAGAADDVAVRARLEGLWMQAAENVDDAIALPGPDWFGVSFVTGDGAPLIVVSPCETVVSHAYRIVDGHLVLSEPLTRPATRCPSAKLDRRTNQLYAQLARRPKLDVTGDQLAIGDEFVFIRNEEMPLDPAAHTPTIDELRGRTFGGLSVSPDEIEPATLTFGPHLVVRTPCSVIEADTAITDGRLRTTVTQRALIDEGSCDDSSALAIVTAWPRVALNETGLLLATAGMSSVLAERATPTVAPSTTAGPTP
jgi:hypothetical protein